MPKQSSNLQTTFDYHQLVRQYKSQLKERIARYVVENPTERLPDIARAFHVNRFTVQVAMVANGVKRDRGCKTFHYPRAARP